MLKRKRVARRASAAITVLACSGLMVLLLVSCGGVEPTPFVVLPDISTPEPGQTPAEATQAPAEPAQTLAAADDSWDRIQAAGKILVGTSADYPPFESYVAPGQIDGFDIALMDEIGRRLGLQVSYVDFPFDALLSAGQTGQIDIAISAISRTPEREAVVGFSNVYLVGEGAALAQQDADITLTKLEDVAGYKVGLQRNSVYKNAVQTKFIDQGLMSPDNLFVYERAQDAVNDLLAGRIELVVMDAQAAQAFADEGGAKVVGIGGAQQLYAIAMPREAGALKAKIDEQITALINEGFVAALSERYLGTPLVLPTPTPWPPTPPEDGGAPAPTPTCVNNAALVQHLTVEGEMVPGQAFTKGWQVKNTGTCPWTTGYRLVFATGAKMAGDPVALAREVKPGETYDWQLPLVAPQEAGSYEGVWQMVDAQGMGPSTSSGQAFGERLKINVSVKAGPTATPKPKPTALPNINFTVDRDQIKAGECVAFSWTVTNVKAYYFHSQFENWQDHAKTGDTGSEKECPQVQTTYYLRAVYPDNSVPSPWPITIYVQAVPEAPRIAKFTVDPNGEIARGTTVTLRWQVDGKVDWVRLTANGAPLWDPAPNSGNTTHTPEAAGPMTYLLEVGWPGGPPITEKRQITVVEPVQPVPPEPPAPDPEIYLFDVTSSQIEAGNCVNVSWSVGGGTASVTLLRDGAVYLDGITDFNGSFCDTLDTAREYTYRLLARGQAKDVSSEVKKVNVTAAPPQNPLAGTHWAVTSLQDGAVPIVPDAPLTITFGTDGTVTGAGACMAFGGNYGAQGDSIWIAVQSTALNCSELPDIEARMAQDAGFLDLFPMATNFSLDGDYLLILDPGGMRLMELRLVLW
jgi:polar amino acid transport system substrate-binding protein